jgi:hypothetical protein
MNIIDTFSQNNNSDELLIIQVLNEKEREEIYQYIENTCKLSVIGLYSSLFSSNIKFKNIRCNCGEFTILNKNTTICNKCKKIIDNEKSYKLNVYYNNVIVIGDYIKKYEKFVYNNNKIDKNKIDFLLKSKNFFIINNPNTHLSKKELINYININIKI